MIVATDGSSLGPGGYPRVGRADPSRPRRGWGWYASDGTHAFGHCEGPVEDGERAAVVHALRDAVPGEPILLVTDCQPAYDVLTGARRPGPAWTEAVTLAAGRAVECELRTGPALRLPEQAVAHWLAFLGRERVDRPAVAEDIAEIIGAGSPFGRAHDMVRELLGIT